MIADFLGAERDNTSDSFDAGLLEREREKEQESKSSIKVAFSNCINLDAHNCECYSSNGESCQRATRELNSINATVGDRQQLVARRGVREKKRS